MPKWYIKCDGCGEVFDDLDAAVDHDLDRDETYTLVSEEEAF